MRYKLYYGQHMIALVDENEADFPTFFGQYELKFELDSDELSHVRAYIDYSVRVWPLIEQGREDEVLVAEEEKFSDLIESNDWCLVAADSQRRIPILNPIFCTGNRVNWRLNPN